MFGNLEMVCNDDTYHISQILMEMPFDPSLTGFKFFKEAIELVVNSDSFQINLLKEVYCLIANKYEITISQVDKSIRNLIYNASKYSRNNPEIVYPNYVIRNALLSTKSKSLIIAIAEYTKCCKKKYIYEKLSKTVYN